MIGTREGLYIGIAPMFLARVFGCRFTIPGLNSLSVKLNYQESVTRRE